jgi:hypothetical protein
MPRPVGVLAAILLCSGCSAPAVPAARGIGGNAIDGTPRQIVPVAAAVFRQHRIPVAREAPDEGLVESGRFEVGPFWDTEPVESRVECGAGGDLARGARIQIEITLHATPVLATTPATVAAAPARSSVTVMSEGALMEGETGVRCHLTESFATRLVSEVAAALPR